MEPTMEEIDYIAKLSKLKLTEKEADLFAKGCGKILLDFKNASVGEGQASFKVVKEEEKTPLRVDVKKDFPNKEKLFDCTKEIKEKHIVIPKVIE